MSLLDPHTHTDPKTGIESEALISPCQQYRYALTRTWNKDLRGILYLGFNPSTATADRPDQTDRKCKGITMLRRDRGWYAIMNPFAYRARHPHHLKQVYVTKGEEHAVGPENNREIVKALRAALANDTIVVAAWGTLGGQSFALSRIQDLVQQCRHEGVTLHCLGQTKAGHPRHPLMVSYKQPIEPLPQDWAPPLASD